MYGRIDARGKAALDLYYKKWRTVHMPQGMIEEVLRLWDAGVIELVDKEFPDK